MKLLISLLFLIFQLNSLCAIENLHNNYQDGELNKWYKLIDEKYNDEHQETIDELRKWSDNFSNPVYYENSKFKKDKEIKKFNDLSNFEKNLIYFISIEKLSTELKKLDDVWNNKKDTEKYYKKLFELRKLTAKRYETFAENFFNDFKDNFTNKEINSVMNKIRSFHNNDNLLERKKQ